MNIRDRLLALDAAACACECIGVPAISEDLKAAIQLLQDELDKTFNSTDKSDSFESFLEEQKAAVRKLVHNPQVFGGEL